MKVLLVLSILLVPLIILATLAWWRIGDNWADNEHKRFKDKQQDPDAPGPRVISSFNTAPHSDTHDAPNAPPHEDRDQPGA